MEVSRLILILVCCVTSWGICPVLNRKEVTYNKDLVSDYTLTNCHKNVTSPCFLLFFSWVTAQAEKSEPKWNRDGRKERVRYLNEAQRQRPFSVVHLGAQGSRAAERPLISLPLCIYLSVPLPSEPTSVNTSTPV